MLRSSSVPRARALETNSGRYVDPCLGKYTPEHTVPLASPRRPAPDDYKPTRRAISLAGIAPLTRAASSPRSNKIIVGMLRIW
jgi:hypothetical protein